MNLVGSCNKRIGRVYLKGIEYGKYCWNNVSDIRLDDIDSDEICINSSPLMFLEALP